MPQLDMLRADLSSFSPEHGRHRIGAVVGISRDCRGRLSLLAIACILALPQLSTSAHAVCAPAAADNVAATCNGSTTNQNGLDGYGTSTVNNLGVTVVQGASVTGTNSGILFNTGAVVNYGAIASTNDRAVSGFASATVSNFGSISGYYGVYSGGDATVSNAGVISGLNADGVHGRNDVSLVNSGTITAAFDGVFALNRGTVINSGSISGSSHGIYGQGDLAVTNSGSITSPFDAIYAPSGNATVINSGTISMTGTSGSAMYALTSLTLVNSGTITSLSVGPFANGNIDVTNSGLIVASGPAISATNIRVTNSGTIIATAGSGISADNTANVTNSGLVQAYYEGVFATQTVSVLNSGSIISQSSAGIYATSDAIVSNSGLITGSSAGIRAVNGSARVINSGTIVGAGLSGIGVTTGARGDVINSGTIVGGSGTAIRFGAANPAQSDSLTVLPGARFGGVVDFTGGADKVSFGPGSWILNTANFDKTLSAVSTAGNPYVVTANQIIVADLSGFAAQNRAIMDVTGWISSVLPDAPVFAPAMGGASNAFAAADAAASPFEAFASFPSDALGYAKAPAFKAASASYGEGHTVWAKAFGGQRQQDSNGAFIGGTTTGYGGAVGYERLIDPELRIGALIGGSSNRTDLYLNAGSTGTDTVFGGAYGRKTWGATFLDLSVIGGNLDNTSVRNVGGGLGFATATASYGGWFVDPALMFGRRLDVDGRGFTITPAVKVRYVAAHFDGYTETGAGLANLVVAGRDFQAFEERAELTFANTAMLGHANRMTARVTAGILGQQRSAGGQVNVVLLGQTFLAATPDRSSVAGGYVSAGLDWQMGKLALFALGEGTYTNEAARTYAGKGGVRVSW